MDDLEIAYRHDAMAGSSGFGILVALYDTLSGNLRRAIDAQRRGDLETRYKEVNHALLVLGYLQQWVEEGSQGELAEQLTALYADIRSSLLVAQVRQSTQLLEEKMMLLLQLRQIWQDLELHSTATAMLSSDTIAAQEIGFAGARWSA